MPKRIAIAFITIFVLVGGIMRFHWGPPWVRPGTQRVLAEMKAPSGDMISIVAKRTADWIEAYQVSLFRISATDGRAFEYWLGFEDSYWWGAGFRTETNGGISIRAIGQTVGTYNDNAKIVTLTENLEVLVGRESTNSP